MFDVGYQVIAKDCRYFSSRVELAKELFHGRGAELGVYYGYFSEELIQLENVKELWLIDCWSAYEDYDPQDSSVFLNRESGDQAYLHVVASFRNYNHVRVVRGLIEDILPQFREGNFDWVYIDAGHKFHHVLRHLELSLLVVKKDGIIAGHDYWNTGHIKYLAEVSKAVDFFCQKYNLQINYISDEPCGSFGIIKNF